MTAKQANTKTRTTGDPLGQWHSAIDEWSERTLWDLADYINGRAFKPTDFSKIGLPVIKITELKYGISEDTDYFEGAYERKHLLSKGDLLFAWSGNPETSLDAYWWHDGSALLNQHIFRVVPHDGVEKAYLHHLLKFLRPTFVRTARDKATSMGHVKVSDLKRLIARIPSPSEQRAIAHVLGTLDDGIVLRQRMNATLEAMARVIFKSWFVDFDPVRAKAEGRQPHGMDVGTADLFPDSFQDSTLGRIPQGWTARQFGDIAENPRRGVNPGEVPAGTPYIGLEHMPRKSIALTNWDHSEEVGSHKFAFRQGEILFGKLRPYFHKVGVAVQDGVCSTDILVVKANAAEWHGLVLGHISSEEFVSYADAVSTGTKMPRTNWQDMASYKIALPDSTVAAVFSSFSRKIVEMIRQNILQSNTLAAMRDTLLPKLLSGEIRVPTSHPAEVTTP